MAIVGKLIPQMENERTPQRDATLNAMRIVPIAPKRKIPNAWEANTKSNPVKSIGMMPLLQGKCRNLIEIGRAHV